MKLIRILSALFIAALFASCNQGGSVNDLGGGNSGMWTIPGAGALYVYQTTPGFQQEFDTLLVIANELHLGGKTNVVKEYLIKCSI